MFRNDIILPSRPEPPASLVPEQPRVSLSRPARTRRPEVRLRHDNVNDLARIITSEAGGLNQTAQAMVGWTVINRMKKHHLTRVSEVWANHNYAHEKHATGSSLHLAENLLDGSALDISHGATHFYSPSHAEGRRSDEGI